MNTFPASLSIIPIGDNKRSLIPWEKYQSTIADPSQLPHSESHAAICGAVSGNLECIDYDIKNDPTGLLLEAYKEIIEATDPGLLAMLYQQSTPSGGMHLVYRTDDPVDNNLKLATVDGKAVFETRGEGGYFLIAPSVGYAVVNASLDSIPVITADQRALLLSTARSFSDPAPEQQTYTPRASDPNSDGELSPLDDYNRRSTDTIDILTRNGFTVAFTARDGTVHLSRPGKTPKQGTSATFNSPRLSKPNRLYVFSTSTVFEAGRSYSPAAVLATLEYGGDYSALAKHLRAAGYGAAVSRRVITTDQYTDTPQIVREPISPDEPIRYLYREQHGDAQLFRLLIGATVIFDQAEKLWYRFNDFTDDLPPHWHQVSQSAIYNLMAASLANAYDLARRAEADKLQAVSNDLNALTQAPPEDTAARLQHEKLRETHRRIEATIKLITKRVQQMQTAGYIRGVLTFAEALCSPDYGDNETLPWDANPWLLGVANGTVDLRTGHLVSPSPTHYIRKYTPTPYRPNASCARFQRFITEIFNEDQEPGDAAESDPETPLSSFLHRLLGYGITGLSTEHVYPILYGSKGRNGKDTLLNTLVAVLGGNVAKPVAKSIVMESRNGGSGEGASPQLYDLRGARIIWVNETEEHDRVKAADLKSLSGGTRITCRPLYGRQVHFAPTHLPLLITNHKPYAAGSDDALWRRVVLVPFSIEFISDPDPNNPKQRKADTTLTASLAEEKEGILAWLIAGCLEWQRVGLSIPALVHSETKEYRDEMEEAVREFFDGYVKRDLNATGSLTIGQIHSKYLQWARENSVPYPIKSPRGFSPYCRRFIGDPVPGRKGNVYEMTVVTYVGGGRLNYN